MKKLLVALGIILLFATCKKEVPQKTLTVNVTPSVGGSVTPSSGIYPMGSSVTLIATPSAEYIFKEWTGGFTGTTNPANIVMDLDKVITCVFEKRQYPLSLTIVGSGTVKEEIIKMAPASTNYISGTTVRLTPQPAVGYEFKNWSGDDTSSKSPLDIVVSKPINITCNFIKEEDVKFTTNLDTGKLDVTDTIPLTITVSSKIPAAGFIYSITSTWTDSSKQIFKLDTTLISNKLTLSIPGHKRIGNYTIAVSVTSKTTSSNTSTKNITASNIPYVSAVNVDLFPNINWNDHAQAKNGTYDFNQDGIPDIISYRRVSEKSPLPSILEIKDYLGNNIYNFNLKDFKPGVRDSLQHIIIDYRDLNNDGYLDFGLSYMGEWWTGQNGAPGSSVNFIGNNIYLLLSKGKLQYQPVEVLDEPFKPLSFNITLFDWDLDGLDDVLLSDLNRGDYLKNLGNNNFQRGSLGKPFFNQSINNKLDFDKDGKIDLINLYVNQLDENNRYVSNDMSQTLSVLSKTGVKNYNVVGKTIKKYIYILGDIESAERIAMVDGDGDGDLDLIVGSIKTKANTPFGFAQDYYENTGNQFEYRANYIQIDDSLIGELQVWTADIDKDGDMDLFYPTYSKSRLNSPKWGYFWWENTKQGFKINKNFKLKF